MAAFFFLTGRRMIVFSHQQDFGIGPSRAGYFAQVDKTGVIVQVVTLARHTVQVGLPAAV
jgi:hypothetical protein